MDHWVHEKRAAERERLATPGNAPRAPMRKPRLAKRAKRTAALTLDDDDDWLVEGGGPSVVVGPTARLTCSPWALPSAAASPMALSAPVGAALPSPPASDADASVDEMGAEQPAAQIDVEKMGQTARSPRSTDE